MLGNEQVEDEVIEGEFLVLTHPSKIPNKIGETKGKGKLVSWA